MEPPADGCAICGSTWGDVWAELEEGRRFFCCDLCEIQYRELVARVKQRTGWSRVDRIDLVGDRRGRAGTAASGGREYGFWVAFNSLGHVRRFEAAASVSPDSPSAIPHPNDRRTGPLEER